jgi:hypothetical protein
VQCPEGVAHAAGTRFSGGRALWCDSRHHCGKNSIRLVSVTTTSRGSKRNSCTRATIFPHRWVVLVLCVLARAQRERPCTTCQIAKLLALACVALEHAPPRKPGPSPAMCDRRRRRPAAVGEHRERPYWGPVCEGAS